MSPLRNDLWQRVVTALTVLAFALMQGCTTWQPVEPDQPLFNQVQVGDPVRVELKDGRELEFDVVEKTESGISGEEAYVDFADIADIEVNKVSTGATTGGLIVAYVVIGTALMALLLNDFGDAIEDAFDD